MNSARIEAGTVIHGTHRPEDLLPAFANELLRVSPGYGRPYCSAQEAIALAERFQDDTDDSVAHWEASEVISELQDEINEYAPPGLYFGAHIGDGADFGWWPVDTDDE